MHPHICLSIRGGVEQKKLHNLLCDKTCRCCCWDMKIQVWLPDSSRHTWQQVMDEWINELCCFTDNPGNGPSDISAARRSNYTAHPSQCNHPKRNTSTPSLNAGASHQTRRQERRSQGRDCKTSSWWFEEEGSKEQWPGFQWQVAFCCCCRGCFLSFIWSVISL